MSDLDGRIAELSPDRRRLLEQLLAKSRERQATATAPDQPEAVSIQQRRLFDPLVAGQAPLDSHPYAGPTADGEGGTSEGLNGFAKEVRGLYERINQQLNVRQLGRYSRFLNLGYTSDGSLDHAQVELPQYHLNKNSIKLVLEVVGRTDLANRRVLDVGCGRGGTIEVISQYFTPKTLTGMDLSFWAMSFCHRLNTSKQIAFLQGDAQRLPFRTEAFDVVTNIESSHNYPNMFAFYSDVARVLKPGGWFLYSDLITVELAGSYLSFLRNSGLEPELDRDITANVLLSCDEIAANRLAAFDEQNDQVTMRDFLGVPGSGVHASMTTGQAKFRILHLRKTSG